MPIQTLSLSVSSPTNGSKKTVDGQRLLSDIPGLAIPIELANNCSEDGVTIESDDVALTNAVRRHYLEHFGHRNLDGTVSDYAAEAIIMQMATNASGKVSRKKYHGLDEIRNYFRDEIFELHPVGDSSFKLEHISIHQKHAMVVWSAKTPTLVIDQASETLVFNRDGKILKQFFNCHTHLREDPKTFGVVRRDSKECSDFFE